MMNKKFLVFMFLFIGIFVIANVSAWSEDEFNNSLTNENITFSGSENFTRWLTVPENIIVTNGLLNLSGYENNRIIETFVLDNVSGVYPKDITGLYTNGTYIWILDGNNAETVYKYYMNKTYTGDSFRITDFYSNNDGHGLTADSECFYITDNQDNEIYKYYINGTGACGLFNSITSEPQGITTNGTNLFILDYITKLVHISYTNGTDTGVSFNVSDEISSNPTKITTNGTYIWISSNTNIYKYNMNGTYANDFFNTTQGTNIGGIDITNGDLYTSGSRGNTSIYKIRTDIDFPNNPILYINSTNVWNQSGELNSTNSPQKTSNFASTINSYIESATAIAGNYLIPFIFHSDTAGILEYLALVFSSDGYLTQSTTYDATITEGQSSTVLESILVSPENSLTSAIFNYNNTNYTTNIIFSGNEYNISSTMMTPLVSTDTNISFSFFLVIDGVTYETTSYNHTVTDIAFSNCTAGDALATFLLVDEELQTALSGDIEISAYITNPTTSAVVSSINLSYTNVSNASICLTPNSSFNDYKLFYEVRYTADDYVSEFYNVKNANMSAYPKYIALYDLASNDSTEFIVEYRNDNYVTIEDAVVLLLRQYLAEDSYKVVEAPTTSSTGTSILHVDLNTNKYRVIVLKDGVILNTFTNIVFHCENELSGQCTQELYGGVDPQNTVTLESLDDFSYSVTKVNETLTLTYSVPSGSASVNLYLYQIDLFGNTYLCNETVYSSGGSIDCSYNNTIGDSMVYLEVRKDGELMASKSYFVEENTDLGFLGNNFFIVFIFIVTITGMALSSPEWMVIMSVITLLLTGSLWLLNGLTFAIGFGSLMWLIVAAGIIIFKLSRQEDR